MELQACVSVAAFLLYLSFLILSVPSAANDTEDHLDLIFISGVKGKMDDRY